MVQSLPQDPCPLPPSSGPHFVAWRTVQHDDEDTSANRAPSSRVLPITAPEAIVLPSDDTEVPPRRSLPSYVSKDLTVTTGLVLAVRSTREQLSKKCAKCPCLRGVLMFEREI